MTGTTLQFCKQTAKTNETHLFDNSKLNRRKQTQLIQLPMTEHKFWLLVFFIFFYGEAKHLPLEHTRANLTKSSLISAIVNGYASVNRPFYVRLISLSRTVGFFCGGTLISRRWVITTATCLQGINGPIEVETGDFSDEDTRSRRRHQVAYWLTHEQYDNRNKRNNLGMVKLVWSFEDEVIDWSTSSIVSPVLPICEADASETDVLTAVGMGSTSNQFIVLPRVLQEALFKEHLYYTIGFLQFVPCLPDVVCTEPLNNRAHLGFLDNGSPLYKNECGTQKPLCLYGVAAGCVESETCHRNLVGKSQFVKIIYHYEWILQKLRSS